MLHHIVMWKLKDFADGKTKSENAILMKEGLEKLFPAIDQIKRLEVGINMEGSVYANYDIVLDTLFDSYEDMELYQCHPLHKKISKWIGTVRESRVAVDYEI